ncbi:MAG: NgoFVII family restriction endonuclease [Clostridia bacterium]
MFYEKQNNNNKENYSTLLKTVGAMSNLFSDSYVPYMDYRVVENIFCKAFDGNNLSRLDCSVDVSKDNIGIGIKTFLHSNGKTFQKIAEFNDKSSEIRKIDNILLKVQFISNLRNERINVTERLYGLKKSIYHCLTRQENKFNVFELEMDKINLSKIKIIKYDDKSIIFTDEINEYNFNISKSVLMRRFNLNSPLLELPITIVNDPYELLINALTNKFTVKKENIKYITAFLPLYSFDKSINKKYVPKKSALNQWNASGRKRNLNEVYINIPSIFNKENSDFFPNRDKSFKLLLPNGKELDAKVCQDNSKALMSNPNSVLGKWLLRDILQLNEGELVTYEKLSDLGIDSVVITKISNEKYKINFAKSGSYDNFINNQEEVI